MDCSWKLIDFNICGSHSHSRSGRVTRVDENHLGERGSRWLMPQYCYSMMIKEELDEHFFDDDAVIPSITIFSYEPAQPEDMVFFAAGYKNLENRDDRRKRSGAGNRTNYLYFTGEGCRRSERRTEKKDEDLKCELQFIIRHTSPSECNSTLTFSFTLSRIHHKSPSERYSTLTFSFALSHIHFRVMVQPRPGNNALVRPESSGPPPWLHHPSTPG